MFRVVSVAGALKIKKLPYPLFPTKYEPKTKGFELQVQNNNLAPFTVEFTPDVDIEFLGVSIACSSYSAGDYWELEIGTEKPYETIYTKELPESINIGNMGFGIVYPVAAGTLMKFSFYNASETLKIAWINLKYLK